MPRSVPQSFARKLGLQVIMWGLFVAALAGATQLSRDRADGLAIGPLQGPIQFGWIKVAIPQNWKFQASRGEIQIVATEPEGTRFKRVLIVSQEPLDGPPDPDYLFRELKHEVPLSPIQFAGLNVTGHLARFTVRDEQTGAPTQEYFAQAVLPDDVVIKVQLLGVPGFGPVDSENFQTIVDHISSADNPPRNPLLRRPDQADPIADWHDRPVGSDKIAPAAILSRPARP
jgi:hypothetical protein